MEVGRYGAVFAGLSGHEHRTSKEMGQDARLACDDTAVVRGEVIVSMCNPEITREKGPTMQPGSDVVSMYLKNMCFRPHTERTTTDKKIRWDSPKDYWIAVMWRPSFATFRVEFQDPRRVLSHRAIYESGRQFQKNGGRSFVFDPKVQSQVDEVMLLVKEWCSHYA